MEKKTDRHRNFDKDFLAEILAPRVKVQGDDKKQTIGVGKSRNVKYVKETRSKILIHKRNKSDTASVATTQTVRLSNPNTVKRVTLLNMQSQLRQSCS